MTWETSFTTTEHTFFPNAFKFHLHFHLSLSNSFKGIDAMDRIKIDSMKKKSMDSRKTQWELMIFRLVFLDFKKKSENFMKIDEEYDEFV